MELIKIYRKWKLDTLGKQGWELCGVIEYARSYYYYFKKLIND